MFLKDNKRFSSIQQVIKVKEMVELEIEKW